MVAAYLCIAILIDGLSSTLAKRGVEARSQRQRPLRISASTMDERCLTAFRNLLGGSGPVAESVMMCVTRAKVCHWSAHCRTSARKAQPVAAADECARSWTASTSCRRRLRSRNSGTLPILHRPCSIILCLPRTQCCIMWCNQTIGSCLRIDVSCVLLSRR